MSTVLEYSYDYEDEDGPPLSDKEAVEKYEYEKAIDHDSLVILKDLNSGVHWRVKVYRTEAEKEAYLTKQVIKIWERFANKFAGK
jgi:hypothetical protein